MLAMIRYCRVGCSRTLILNFQGWVVQILTKYPSIKPIVKVVNNERDGFHRMAIDKGKTAYTPNSFNDGYPKAGLDPKAGYVHYPEQVTGPKIQVRNQTFQDHYSQATLFWNSMSEA